MLENLFLKISFYKLIFHKNLCVATISPWRQICLNLIFTSFPLFFFENRTLWPQLVMFDKFFNFLPEVLFVFCGTIIHQVDSNVEKNNKFFEKKIKMYKKKSSLLLLSCKWGRTMKDIICSKMYEVAVFICVLELDVWLNTPKIKLDF